MTIPRMEAILDDAKAKKLIQKLGGKALAIKDRKNDYLSVMSAVVFADVMDHFLLEKGPKGPWKAWSRAYSEHMDRIGKGGNKVLQDSGRLRGSFYPTNHRLTSDGILWFNPAKTKGGFPYAAAHDEGGETLPQRKFMYLSDHALEKMASQTLEFLEREN